MSKFLLLGIITVITLLTGNELLATTYYSKGATGDPTQLTSWTNTANANPANFTSGDTFIILNGCNFTIPTLATWTVNATTGGTAATVQINSTGALTFMLGSGQGGTLQLGGNLVQTTASATAGLVGNGSTVAGLVEFTSNGTWTGSADTSNPKIQITIDSGVTLDASSATAGFKLRNNTLNIAVNGTLNLGKLTITAGGSSCSFTLGASGTLITATTSTSGLPGIFSSFSAGKITLPTTANYVFNGTNVQVTGTSANNATMPATVNNLTFSNSLGFTLSQATTVNGALTLTAGKVTGNVTLGSGATISGGSSTAYVNGQLTVPFTTAPSSASFTFPVGTASAYSPISIANFTDPSTGTLTASATATQNPNQGSSGIDSLLYIARYWTLTGTGFSSPTYDFTGTFVPSDNINAANTASLIVQKWDGSSWANPTGNSSTSTTVTGTGFTTSFGQFAAGQAQTTIPILDTTTQSAVTNTSATLGATLENNYSLSITNYGIVWGTSANPTTASNLVSAGMTTPTLGSPFTASVTGLPAATTIYYRGYAINTSGQTGYSTNASFLTLANEPTAQSSGVVCSTLQNGSIPISWTRGNGSKCIVLVSAGAPVSSAPVDGTTYTASATYGSGTQIGSGNYVAYLGTGTNVTLTGLSTSTTYYVAVYELNGSGGSENYLTVSPATGSQLTGATFVTTLTWTGTVDTDWNKTGNWDGGLVPGVGTSVVIPITANQPVYSNQMVAASFGSLTQAGVLNVNTNGFNSGAILLLNPSGSAQMYVNNGGIINVSGNLGICSNGIASMSANSSLSISGGLNIGSDITGGNSGTGTVGCFGSFTNWGGTLSAGSTSLNPRNDSISTSCRLVIAGGTNNLGAVNIQRAPGGNNAPSALGSDGLVISNGVVNMSGISLGNNAHGIIYLVNGLVTNNGTFTIQNATATRPARFVQTGGVFVNTNTVTMTGTADTVYAALGGTNSVAGFVLSGTTILFTNATQMFIGNAGISGSSSSITALLNPNGTFGASADWTNTVSITLNGGNFNCQNASGTPHNIYSSGVLTGASNLTKTGNGTLTLNAADTYSGNTVINAGSLVVGASGSLNNSSKFYVGSGATFDVSAVTGGFTIANQTLTGLGVVTGAVAIASSVTTAIDPGSNTLTGTLSFSNSVTETGGAIIHFDLAGAPNPSNDLIVIAGDFDVSGTNTLDISGSSLLVGSVYPLIKYGGNFNGGLTNFIVTTTVGVLTNDPTAKVISLIPQATLRGPTNIVWIGNPANTNWDNEVSTNWLNAGALDYFVPKDSVQFTDAGASNSPVNIVGIVTPTSILVNSHSNYLFASTSGGSIGDPSTGPANLTVTNTGTLTIATTNTYTGITTIDGGGALAVSQVANVNSPSPVGESDSLVINNGTFIYSGPNASINRGATLGNAAAAINVSANGSLTLNGVLGGSGGLTKTGNGNLILPSGNSYAGGTFVNAGTLTLNSISAAGSGILTLNGGTLALGAVKPANTINVTANSIITGGNSGGLTGIKDVTGSSNLLVNVTSSSGVFDLTGDMSAYSGIITFSNAGGGVVRFNGATGSALATWDLGTGSMDLNIRTSSTSNSIGALEGGSGTTLSGRGGSGNSGANTYYVGANGLSTIFGGIIQNGNGASGSTPSTSSPTAIIKLGTGSLSLTGASTYTGSTTVNAGTLEVDGSLASGSSVTVNGGTLAGSGTVGGTTTLNASAILSPGSSSVGTLTFGGNLTLNAASTNSFAVTTIGGVSNSVTVNGTLNPNGSVIQITSGTSLAVGTYTLFNYSGISGSFNATPVFDVAPAQTASIVDTGSGQINLVVATPGPSSPGYITNSISGSTLSLTWPAGQGWRLVSQTNDLTTGLSTNWFTVPGVSDGSATITVDPTQPTVFYELVYP